MPRGLAGLISLAGLVSLLLATSAEGAATAKISRNGKTVTVVSKGRSADLGTNAPGTIKSYAGRIRAGRGCRNDYPNQVFCGYGWTRVTGSLGGGNDDFGTIFSKKLVLAGGRGADGLYAGIYNDKLWGGPGKDDLYGGSGNDYLVGGPGRDMIDCSTGIDVAVVGPGDITEECERIRRRG